MTSASMAPANGKSGGPFRIFTDRKINTKIGIGFACVLVITAGLSAVATIQFDKVEHNFSDYSHKVANNSIVSDIDRQFVAFRRYAGEVSDNIEENFAAADKTRKVLREHIAQALKGVKNPERHTKVVHLSEQFDIYSKDFDKVVVLRREQAKLTKEILDPTGAKLRTEIEQLQSWAVSKAGNSNTMLLAGEALKQLMIARLNVNKMLARHDDASAQEADKAFAGLKTAMAAFGGAIVNDEVRRLFTEVNTNVENYFNAYKKAAHDSHEIEKLFHGEMRTVARALTADAEAIKAGLAADEKAVESETHSLISSVERLVMLLAIGGLALGALLAWAIGRGISRPIQGMTGAMTALAAGDLKVVVPAQDNKDEIGEMAKAVLVFRDAAVDKVRMEREAEEERVRSEEARRKAEEEAIARERAMVSNSIGAGMSKLADKDLTFRLTDDLPQAYKKLQSDFNGAVEQLEKALQGVRSSSQAMDSGTQEISTASNDLSRRTEQQASSLEETAAALDEITATVKKAAEGATHARGIVASTKTDAEKSGEVVRKAVEAMGSIEKSSQQISQIIGVIDEIAFQTNLLALNAGVEAARAGDAGRGFAVVASEVRALAQRSAEAAKEIKGLISTSTTQVEQGVELVAETGKSLEVIVSKVAEINTVVTDIAAGAQEQATGLQQVNTAVNQMDKVTQQNAAMAEEATAASRSLSQESSELSSLVALFKVGDTGAAHPVRRAVARPEPVKSEAQATRRQMKAPAGRNGSAVRKPEPAADQDSWQDF